MKTHVPISDEHFTPFASLLLHFPMAVSKAIGGPSQIYYEYKPRKRLVEATVYYRRTKDGVRLLGERIDLGLTRTDYSFEELVAMVKEEFDWADDHYNNRDDGMTRIL